MTWYAQQHDAWTQRSSPAPDGHSIQVHADEDTPPTIRFLERGQEFFSLAGVDPRPATDTTHTVASIDFEGTEGILLFAVHAEDNTLTFEDLRPRAARDASSDEKFEQVQSSLDEILIPVYIDDVIGDLSEELRGLVTLHTAQYEGSDKGSWTYFRTSTFEDGDLAFEDEYGTM